MKLNAQHVVLWSLVALTFTACTKSEEETWTAVTKTLPWMMTALENCEGFKNATRDAEKNDYSALGPNFARTVEVSQAKGEVEKIFPVGEGEPTGYAIQIDVEERVRFATDSKTRKLDKSSPVFAAAAKLTRGECVIFSATDLTPIAGSAMGRVCDFSYYAKFTSITPCP